MNVHSYLVVSMKSSPMAGFFVRLPQQKLALEV
jgi:hypothetical protein